MPKGNRSYLKESDSLLEPVRERVLSVAAAFGALCEQPRALSVRTIWNEDRPANSFQGTSNFFTSLVSYILLGIPLFEFRTFGERVGLAIRHD